MKKIIFSLIFLFLAMCFVTLPQALADTPISCSDILKQNLSEGDGEYLVDPDGPGGKDAFLVYCDMTNGGWQLIYNRNNAYFTPDHMVQRYPNETINFNVNSTSWYIPPDAGLWKWEISVNGGTTWRGITTGIPGIAFANTHNTVINVPVSQVSDNSLSSSGPFYYQTFTLEDQCLFGCGSGSATWWGIVNVSQGAGDKLNPGIGGHSDSCDLDNNLVTGDNYTWGDDDLEIYLSDYKNIQGDGIGGTNCIPDGPTDLYRYRFWARTGETELVYFNDFEGVVGSEWSNPSTDTTPIGARKFLGQFINDAASLTLNSLPPHSTILVSFDLFIIESWDGNNITFGPDFWELSVENGPTLLKTTFSNAFESETDFRQAYPDWYPGGDNTGLTGAAETDTLGYPDYSGYAGANDSVYRLIFTVPHSASSLLLNFSGSNLEGAAESWGIDNISVSIIGKFVDVPTGYWAEEHIYKIYEAGITTGCSQDPLMFCPKKIVNRDQMAVFLGRATHDSNFTPPDATGIFADVPVWYWAADWIEQFYADGLTKGCKIDPHDVQSPVMYYCPKYPVTRTTMAIFLLRAKHGANYQPPPATGIFEDVWVNYWAADWIEQLYKEGITTGCKKTPLMYCPSKHVRRDVMAVFLMRTFGL